MFPLTAKDKEAVWNVLSHLLVHINEREMRASTLLPYVSVLLEKSDRIKDILLDPSTGPLSEHSSRAIVTTVSLRYKYFILYCAFPSIPLLSLPFPGFYSP